MCEPNNMPVTMLSSETDVNINLDLYSPESKKIQVPENAVKYNEAIPLKRKKLCLSERTSDQKLSYYNKKGILKHLMANGCGLESCTEVFSTIKADPLSSLSFLNEKASIAQSFVYQECDSLSFQNICKWLDYFKLKSLNDLCYFEAATIITAICKNEEHPRPEEVDGVDFKKIYTFLGNALYGNPQIELNKESQYFLVEEFEKLINEANTEEADLETQVMKVILEAKMLKSKNDEEETDVQYLSLDPLELDVRIKNVLDLD